MTPSSPLGVHRLRQERFMLLPITGPGFILCIQPIRNRSQAFFSKCERFAFFEAAVGFIKAERAGKNPDLENGRVVFRGFLDIIAHPIQAAGER